jgi:hypothetical protein
MNIYQEVMVESNLFYEVSKLQPREFESFIINEQNNSFLFHDIKICFSKQDKLMPVNFYINDEGHNHIVLDITANDNFNNLEILIKDCYNDLINYYKNDENITINNISDKILNIYFHKKQTKIMPDDVKEYLNAYGTLEKDNTLNSKNKIKEEFKISIQNLYKNYLLKIHNIVADNYERIKKCLKQKMY